MNSFPLLFHKHFMIGYETGFKNLRVLCFTYNSHSMLMREAEKELSSCFESKTFERH